jgi:type II secretory pathway component GspD/PulD (secretin)
MRLLPHQADRVRTSVSILAGVALALTLIGAACAQTPQAESGVRAKSEPTTVATIHLTHVTAQRDFNDLQTNLRNMLPMAVSYAMQTQSAISIRGTAEDVETAKKLIAEFDQPRKAYRVTYTFTDMDNGKPVGVHRLAVLVVAGEKAIVKQGNRVPIVTGTIDKDSGAQSSQVQYLDVGLNVEATLDGDRLRSILEQSTMSDEKSGIGVQDPIVHQTKLEATSDLTPGKSVVLGSLDIPGTTRHQEIEAVAERIQ